MNKRAVFLMALFTLSGCSHEEKRANLQNYINEVKQRKSGEIEPLPQIRPYETFAYAAKDLRSPFMPPKPEQIITQVVSDNGIQPDGGRRKELLESFPIDSLKMVGTLEKSGKTWALIVDKEGTLHRISKGNYVGLNHGKVNTITEEKILITEIIPGSQGGWQERQAEMTLTVPE